MKLIDQVKLKYPERDRWSMRNALFEAMSGAPMYVRDKALIQAALIEQGYDALAKKMAQCKPGSRCRNPYCDSCQRVLFEKQRKRSDEFLWYPYKQDESKARRNLFFITILHELIPFDQPDETIIRFPSKRIKAAISEARKQFKAVRRTFKDQINFVGAFELEALNGLLVNLHPVKGQVLSKMSGNEIRLDDKFVLVHSHFLVDLAEWPVDRFTGVPAVEQMKIRLKNTWPGNKQVDVRPLYKTKPVHASLRRLADYPFKYPIKYYYRWNEISVENEVVLKGKKRNLTRNHETDVIAQMVKGVSDIGSNALDIRLGISKASTDKARNRQKILDARSARIGPAHDMD